MRKPSPPAAILQRGTGRQELRTCASTIIRTQSAEVEQMRTWLATWYPGRELHVPYEPMMRDLTGLTGDARDRAFLEDMIAHHMMAVMMSLGDTQSAEIQMMASWLRE